MNLKFGDILQFYFDDDTCWGTEGFHTGIVLYDNEKQKLRLYHLDETMINARKDGLQFPISDDLETFISNWEDDYIVIGNIAMPNMKKEIADDND